MRIVSRKKLIEYYEQHTNSKVALEDWYQKVKKAEWINLNQLKNDFLSADYVGNNRVVFNIKGNDFGLVAIIIYVSQKLYVRWIGTHSEYDKINAKEV
ncbi:MAG: type II toxin-antitoxin system HigB family toxin [Cyclobacteriaceae bacterium]|nr:type II toxin-antitoxin system HigB family toxin [Cyclobacteriaceae bacterium HetDA_MAG_MS6]